MAKSHRDIDWEYIVESIAQRRYCTKVNTLSYSALKDIAEEEVMYYMDNENDTLRAMRNRISFRYKHNITATMEHQTNSVWKGWRENSDRFIAWYEHDLKRGRLFNKYLLC